jgi:hypothetical protein
MWPFLHFVETPYWLLRWIDQPEFFKIFLQLETGFVAIFMLYQVVYWNIIWKKKIRSDGQ